MKFKRKIANNKGITLVALVVTIIAVLILSGITISTMTGENGILTKAAEAKQKTEIAALKEKISLIMLDWETDKALDSTVTVEDFWERLIEEGIIIDKSDIGEPETSGDNQVYTIDTGDGYVIEVIVTPNENITIGDIAKGTDLPLKIKSIDVTEKSSNSISVEVRVRENEGKGDLKLSYYYKTGKGEYEPLEEDTKSLTATFEGLSKGTTYNIKVVVEKDGQTDELNINVKTEDLSEEKVTASLPEWDAATHKASITLSTDTNYQIQYQEGGTEGEWTTVEKGTKSVEISNLDHNDIIYARLWDGYNGGYEEKVTVKDIEDPIVTVTEGTVTTRSIEVTVSSEDNEWGMSDTPTYNYYHKKKDDANYPEIADKSSTETTCTFDRLDQGTEYDIKVTTEDKAGNEGEGELTAIETGTVAAAVEDLATAPLTTSAPTWNPDSHTASITLTAPTNYQIQYQIGGIDGEWTTVEANSATITDLNHNDTVFARLYDGKNAGNEASITVKDDTPPEEATVSFDSATVEKGNKITATVTNVDNQSGVKVEECKWIFTTSPDEIGTEASSYEGEMSGTFSNASQDIEYTPTETGEYWLHVLTIDNAGKKKETVSNTSVEVAQFYSASQVSNNPSLFGKQVSNYDDGQGTEWKVFYADDDSIYLIASNYVPVSKLASFQNDLGFITGGSNYNVYWETNSGNPNFKVTSINETIASKFMLNQLSTFTTSNHNYKMTASLMNTSLWDKFRDKDKKLTEANSVIGNPTLEMWVASWNKRYPADKLYTATAANGYYIGTSNNTTSTSIDKDIMNQKEGYNNTLYYPHTEIKDDCYGYWLASPSAEGSSYQMRVRYNGSIGSAPYNNYYGVRPLVRLKSNVIIKKADNNYVLTLKPE